jgi:hypothetical protein
MCAVVLGRHAQDPKDFDQCCCTCVRSRMHMSYSAWTA